MHLYIIRNNMTFIPKTSQHHREVGCIFHSSSANIWVATPCHICCAGHFEGHLFCPLWQPAKQVSLRSLLWKNKNKNQCSKGASDNPEHPETELKFKLEPFGFQVFCLIQKKKKKMVARRVLRNLTNDGLLRLTQWVTTKNQVFQFSVQVLLPHYSTATQSVGFSQEVFGWDSKPARCK